VSATAVHLGFVLMCMQVSEFKEQLLYATGTKPERILEFTCGVCYNLKLCQSINDFKNFICTLCCINRWQ